MSFGSNTTCPDGTNSNNDGGSCGKTLASRVRAYYLQAVSLEPPGRRVGRGPGQARLSPVVEADDLTSLLSRQDPATEEVLGIAANRVRVHGFDLIFAAPKDHWGWYFCASSGSLCSLTRRRIHMRTECGVSHGWS